MRNLTLHDLANKLRNMLNARDWSLSVKGREVSDASCRHVNNQSMFRAQKSKMVETMQGSKRPAWNASLVISRMTLEWSFVMLNLASCCGGLGPFV